MTEIMLTVCSDYFATLDVTAFPENRREVFANWIRRNWGRRCTVRKFSRAFALCFNVRDTTASFHVPRIVAEYNRAVMASAGY